ncbi:MAG: carboxypeptidase regulatory-like domain-containing protein, partial [Planctomycetota bacterium]
AVRTNAEGRFHVGVQSWARQSQASSDWMVAAGHPEYGIATVKGLKLPKEGGTLEVRVVLARGLTISGRVEWHGGGPVAAANVTLSPKKSGPRQGVITALVQAASASAGGSRSMRSDFDGSFRFAGVPSGTYRLSATTTDGKSRSEEIEAGAMDVRLEVQKTSFIGGQVVDEEGKPVTGASVTVLIPSGKKKESKRSANTSGNGRFRIVHVEAGTYVIEVAPSKQQWWGAPQDHFVKQTLDAVTTGVDDLIIRVDRGAPIRGRVLGPSGKPMRGAGVIAIPKKIERRRGGNYWNAMHPSAVTDAQGEFKLRGVGEQAFELLVLAHGMLPETHDATAGQEGLVIRVSKGGEIRGKLLGVDGKPVSGQWLWLQVVGGEAQKRMSDLQRRAGQSWHQYGQRTGTNTDGDGKFAIVGLIPGEYRINGQIQGGVIPDVKVTSGGPPITIRLERPMTVSGLIVDAQGGPLVFSTENARVWVNARIGNRWLQGTQAHSDGTFEIKNLPAGTLTLQIWGGTDYKAKTVEVEAGTSGLEIALEKNVPKPR